MDRTAIRWRDGFSVGDPLIDTQHRAFFEEIGQILAAIDDNAGVTAVAAFFGDFTRALAQHFGDEEALMQRVGYFGLAEHAAEHRSLLAAVKTIGARLDATTSPAELTDAVNQAFIALIEHLVAIDMRYKTWVMAAQGM